MLSSISLHIQFTFGFLDSGVLNDLYTIVCLLFAALLLSNLCTLIQNLKENGIIGASIFTCQLAALSQLHSLLEVPGVVMHSCWYMYIIIVVDLST